MLYRTELGNTELSALKNRGDRLAVHSRLAAGSDLFHVVRATNGDPNYWIAADGSWLGSGPYNISSSLDDASSCIVGKTCE